ncbi:carbohydrate binding family 9 domain-containing protein [Sediminibacterium roseum]|uniref:Carbohydrate binding family 9 domain-containing protein n=1 Tax=Sediminibacterium roseum TaxID=1978412 RepID=A0ABW9ZRR4_9BACT|nr:carbohydrate binding family 9 domain-containing protein [Sediminibacterium roseum]NCI49796.1 carbohydrate binding family 9 domain-containing protein [Sediminibacterium roseum]
MKINLHLALITIVILLYKPVSAQHSLIDTIRTSFTNETMALDGKLTETSWQSASAITNFTQRELDFGKPSTEPTRVAIVYDKLALYIGVWCYQQPGSIRAKYMQRDFFYSEDDNFQVALSPFNDKRNGYLFVINPNGARADLLISGNEEANQDWNGVWDARTSVTNEGWFAEIRIPFNSLQFKKDSIYNWAINFERNIRSKNEQVSWQGWTRDCSIYCLANAGTLTGLTNIGYAKYFELKPYTLGGFEKEKNQSTNWPGKIGADLNVNLTPTLKLNLTANTDFAQVEVDRIAVNLNRFNLYYPEKREFFLEGYQNYQFNLGASNEIFYTRKIGIENFEQVPIVAGGRLFGKIGGSNIGILNIQTAASGTAAATNNTVVRYKKDIGSQSYIGAILTSKNNSNISNQVAGIDGSYTTSKFLKNKNLVITGLISKSFDKGVNSNNAYAWRFFIDYPNDFIDHFIAIGSIQNDYNPELGFLERKNFDNLTWNFRISPRWFGKYGIRRMYLKPWEFSMYRTHTTGELESFYNESRPFGFFTKSGERFEYDLRQQFERLDAPFDLTGSIKIPVGKYWMHRQALQAGSFQGRRFWIDMVYAWGEFYTGRIKSFTGSLGINVNKHFNLRTDYIYNGITLPQGNTTIHQLAQFFNYAFDPRLDLSVFTQWNSLDDLLFGNFRLHWIPRIGEDLYIVYNRGYDKLNNFRFSEPVSSAGAAKLVWRFVF